MPSPPPPTVFIVDDNEAVRTSLRFLVESIGLPVETFPSGREFLATIRPDRPGCVVMDVRMPDQSGLQIQETMERQGLHLPVIVISGHADVATAVRAMKKGAVDFLEKPCNDQVLLDCIQRALASDQDRRARERRRADAVALLGRLTPREREVLELIVKGFGNRQTASELAISQKTVEVHRARIMKKMAARSVAELVQMTLVARQALEASPR